MGRMPPDHLTPDPARVADAIRAVLAGRDLASAAATAGIEPADLEDAACTYHAAGTAALHDSAASRWLGIRVRFPGDETSEQAMATVLGPRLDQLRTDGVISCWWFLRKHPHWRIRLLHADHHATASMLRELTTAGLIAGWTPARYEAETAAFGGPAGMDIAHQLFCADSQGVLAYARHETPPIGRRELSIMLIGAMTSAARLDSFERGDVFDQIARLRPDPPASCADHMQRLTAQVRTLLASPGPALLADSALAEITSRWHHAFDEAGRDFGAAADRQLLGRGTRAVLAHTVIFHWNRLGLPATTQGILARAAATACLPG